MKYVSAFIAFILFIIVSIVGFRLISNQLKSFGDSKESITQVEAREFKASGAKVRYTIKGPIVADENYRELVFEVGQGVRSVKLYKGYNQSLLKQQELVNNFSAYEAFADALYIVGFMKERNSSSNNNQINDCPSGLRYMAELIDGDGKVKKSLWRVSCNTKSGNMTASPSLVLDLYKKQFPDYKSFSTDIAID